MKSCSLSLPRIICLDSHHRRRFILSTLLYAILAFLVFVLLCGHFLCVCPHVTIIEGVLALSETNGPQVNKTTLFHLHFSLGPSFGAFLSLSFVFSSSSLTPHSLSSTHPPPADLPFLSLTSFPSPFLSVSLCPLFDLSLSFSPITPSFPSIYCMHLCCHMCARVYRVVCVYVCGSLHYGDILYFSVGNVSLVSFLGNRGRTVLVLASMNC